MSGPQHRITRSPAAAGSRHDADRELDLLADIVARLRRALRRGVRPDVPFESLSVAQVELMQHLAEQPGLRARDLGEQLLLAPTTISTLVGQLLTTRLLERRPDPADRRAWHLHLTHAGKDQLDAWQQTNKHVLRAALDQLRGEERDVIVAALPALNTLVQHLGAGTPR